MSTDRSVLAVAILAGCLAARAGAQPPATEGQATWELESPLASSGGVALWLDDGAGSWRLEIVVAEDGLADAADLFERQGEGWTLACAGSSSVLLQPWGKPWRETDPDFAAAVVAVLGRWEGSATAAVPAGGPWRAGRARPVDVGEAVIVGELPDDWTPPGSSGSGDGNLRRELVARGCGRGGLGVRLRLARAPDGSLELTSARWPGRLELSPAALSRRPDVPPEAYLPIWSLAEIGLNPREP